MAVISNRGKTGNSHAIKVRLNFSWLESVLWICWLRLNLQCLTNFITQSTCCSDDVCQFRHSFDEGWASGATGKAKIAIMLNSNCDQKFVLPCLISSSYCSWQNLCIAREIQHKVSLFLWKQAWALSKAMNIIDVLDDHNLSKSCRLSCWMNWTENIISSRILKDFFWLGPSLGDGKLLSKSKARSFAKDFISPTRITAVIQPTYPEVKRLLRLKSIPN